MQHCGVLFGFYFGFGVFFSKCVCIKFQAQILQLLIEVFTSTLPSTMYLKTF